MPVDPEFLRQIDNAIRSDLQSWRDMFFHLLIWSSVLVAIGVALEGPEVIHEVRNIWRIPKLEAADWIKLIGLLGWVLVVVGVAGEGIFEGALSVSDGQIQAFDEILLADAQKQAADANERAEYAREEADSFQYQIADANARTKESESKVASAEAASKGAVAKVATADARIAEAQKGAAEATATAESEKLERLKLEAIVSPRRLTIEQQKAIGSACKGMYTNGPQNRIGVGSYGLDGEGAALAQQIIASLTDGHLYTESTIGNIVQSGGFDTGVIIQGPPEDERFLECLEHSLRNIGKLEVSLNGERHEGGAGMSGTAGMSGSAGMIGSGRIRPAGPLPAGSRIGIFVGIKPVAILPSETKK